MKINKSICLECYSIRCLASQGFRNCFDCGHTEGIDMPLYIRQMILDALAEHQSIEDVEQILLNEDWRP